MKLLPNILCLCVAGALLSACSTVDRLKSVGQAPALTPISNPQARANYNPVSMPMPRQEVPIYNANSLWASGARSFFKDQRATKIGDIVTVRIDISDKAKVSNQTSRSRKGSEDADITGLLGLENSLIGKALPGDYDPAAAINLGSSSSSTGAGAVDRSEQIALTVAAVVTQVLPNGNLVVEGHQEVRINFEVRDLSVSGVVRPEDVSATNEIKHTQLAEARISYGGRGQLSDVQQPRVGQQVVDILFPF